MKTSINPAKTKTEIVVLEEETISLTLTKDEAGHLASILGKTVFDADKINGHDLCRRLRDFVGGQGFYENKYQNLYIGKIQYT